MFVVDYDIILAKSVPKGLILVFFSEFFRLLLVSSFGSLPFVQGLNHIVLNPLTTLDNLVVGKLRIVVVLAPRTAFPSVGVVSETLAPNKADAVADAVLIDCVVHLLGLVPKGEHITPLPAVEVVGDKEFPVIQVPRIPRIGLVKDMLCSVLEVAHNGTSLPSCSVVKVVVKSNHILVVL